MPGKPWYTNGIDEKQFNINKGDIVPDGYYRGRKPKSQAEQNLISQKFKNTMSQKSQEQKDISNEKRSNSLKVTYSMKSDEEKQVIISKRSNTMQSKSDEEKLKYRNKLSKSLIGKNINKEPWNKGLTKETDIRMENLSNKVSKSIKSRADAIKLENPQYFIDIRKKCSNTMRSNHTFNTSKPEEDYYEELLQQYNRDEVIRQYSDDRYPFDCDFYIPSKDLFIELNKHWTHGGHSFNCKDLNDISKLQQWQERAKTSKYYENAIYVWTILDVKKLEFATKNNLNYITIY